MKSKTKTLGNVKSNKTKFLKEVIMSFKGNSFSFIVRGP